MSKPARQIASIYHGSVSAAGAADLPADVYYDTVQWEFSGGAGHRPCPTIGRKKRVEGGIVVSLHTTTRVPRSPPSSVFVHQYIPFPYTFVYKDSLPKYLYFVCPADNGNQKKKRNRKGATREKGVCVCVCVH